MRTITGFNVNPAKRSGDAPFAVPKYAGGSMTASRSFRVPCRNAQEFAFRQMGRRFNFGHVSSRGIRGALTPTYRK